MKFYTRSFNQNGVFEQPCKGPGAPRVAFDRCVKSAVANGYTHVELVSVTSVSKYERIVKSWTYAGVEETGLSVLEQVDIKYGYKIHGFNTTRDPITSANTLKWYETEEAAVKAATSMAKQPSNREALVIYKAIKIVSKADVPVVVQDID